MESIPNLESYQIEIQNDQLNTSFFRTIDESLRKSKPKLIRAIKHSEEESIILEEPDDPTEFAEEDFEITERELMEDSLDEYLDEDEY